MSRLRSEQVWRIAFYDSPRPVSSIRCNCAHLSHGIGVAQKDVQSEGREARRIEGCRGLAIEIQQTLAAVVALCCQRADGARRRTLR